MSERERERKRKRERERKRERVREKERENYAYEKKTPQQKYSQNFQNSLKQSINILKIF